MKRRPLPYGFHYNIPAAFDPSVSYDMQYQRLREIVYSIIDNMEIHIPYMIFTTEAHTNDVVTLTGSFYTDHKEVLANKTFSLKGLPDGTYYININAKYKFEPCEPDCSCVKAISPDSDMTLETVYMPEGGITLYTVVRKNGEITAVNYNDIYTGMHNIAPDAHENRFSDVYAKIKAEVDRATAAEKTLQHNIDNETARAMDAENVLDEKIKAEQNRATAAEHTLQDNINKEQARAEQAEATLQANITAEANRAKAAETGIQKNIDDEAKSRADADTAERNRAVAAEGNLQKNIDNEVANRTAADTAERERAVKAENDLAGDIAAESADRQRADTALDTKLTGLVNAEETRATQAENDIKTALSTEETARINADSKEINDRTAADTALGKRIDTEVSNRTAADTAERDRATAAEENLQIQVTQLQEAGPGFKQDVFSVVEGRKVNDNVTIVLKDFEYFDRTLKELIKASKSTDSVQIQLPKDAVNILGGIKQIHNGEIGRSTVEVVFGNGTISLIGAAGRKVNISGADKLTANEIVVGKISSTSNELLIGKAGTGVPIQIGGVADGAGQNEAVNKKQLDTKQDKITENTSLGVGFIRIKAGLSINSNVSLTSEKGALVLAGTSSLPTVIVRGVEAGVNDNDAVNKEQLDATNTIATTAKQTAETALNTADGANTLAINAKIDIDSLKPRVTALENNVAFGAITLNDTNVSATQSSIQGGANLTINAASLKFQQVYGDLYMLSGYINLTAASQNLIQMTIDLKPTVNKEFSSIFTTVTGDSGLSQQHGNGYVNSYTVVDDDNGNHTKIRLPYLPSATGAKTIGISIMAKLTNI